jgi:S1-C subfamily serine protease
MRSSNFLKLSGAVLVVAFLALAGSHGGTLAGPLAQDAATAAATAATVESPATVVETMSFPPCLPGNPSGAATASAAGTTSATAGATTAATVSATSPGYIGIRVVTVDSCGVQILEVLPNTPAMTAQLMVQDVIVAVNGVAISGTRQLRDILKSTQAGDTIKLTIQRAGAEIVVEVTLGLQPTSVPPTVTAATLASAGGQATTAVPTMAATQ